MGPFRVALRVDGSIVAAGVVGAASLFAVFSTSIGSGAWELEDLRRVRG
jgi:hypothetical protein